MGIRRRFRRRQPRPPPPRQRRLLPGTAGRLRRRSTSRYVFGDAGHGVGCRGAPPRGGYGVPGRDWRALQHSGAKSRRNPDLQVLRAQRGRCLWQDRDLHAETTRWRQRQRYARAPIDLLRRYERVPWRRLCWRVRSCSLLHRRHHQARARDQRILERKHQFLQASGARLRSTRIASLLGAQPLSRDTRALHSAR